jgi:hypothetical protein
MQYPNVAALIFILANDMQDIEARVTNENSLSSASRTFLLLPPSAQMH